MYILSIINVYNNYILFSIFVLYLKSVIQEWIKSVML